MKLSQVFSHWAQVRADLLSTLDEFEDEELCYVPFKGSWSVGEIALHIANSEKGWFQYVLKQEMDEWPDEFSLEDYPSVTAIKALLTEVHAQTDDYLDTLEADAAKRVVETPWGTTITLSWVVWHVIEHEIHHRGELSLMLGMLGRVGLEV
ncbi:MAG: DinB family protein [Anaerolineales bacterium]